MIKVILTATDGSDHAKKAVAMASEIAAKCGAKLVLLHVLLRDARSETLRRIARRGTLNKTQKALLNNYEADGLLELAKVSAFEGGYVVIPPPSELLTAVGDVVLKEATAQARKMRVKSIATKVIDGDAADAILAEAKRSKANLIVLGSRGFGDLKGLLLGSVSHKVSVHAACACLTVK